MYDVRAIEGFGKTPGKGRLFKNGLLQGAQNPKNES
jgi:hypothetical protein